MKVLVTLFLTISLVGCVNSIPEEIVILEFPSGYKIQKANAFNGPIKRIYLVHGFGSSWTDYESQPFTSWINDLVLNGYDVVMFNLPKPNILFYSIDGGEAYGAKFEEVVRNLKIEIDNEFGAAVENIAGGVSFGGLHAMMMVETMPDLFDRYFASIPVTDYTELDELRSGSSQHFNPFSGVDVLAGKPGFIQYGELDERVNFRRTIELINLIERYQNQLEWINLGNHGHVSTSENLQNITDYLLSH